MASRVVNYLSLFSFVEDSTKYIYHPFIGPPFSPFVWLLYDLERTHFSPIQPFCFAPGELTSCSSFFYCLYPNILFSFFWIAPRAIFWSCDMLNPIPLLFMTIIRWLVLFEFLWILVLNSLDTLSNKISDERWVVYTYLPYNFFVLWNILLLILVFIKLNHFFCKIFANTIL